MHKKKNSRKRQIPTQTSIDDIKKSIMCQPTECE